MAHHRLGKKGLYRRRLRCQPGDDRTGAGQCGPRFHRRSFPSCGFFASRKDPGSLWSHSLPWEFTSPPALPGQILSSVQANANKTQAGRRADPAQFKLRSSPEDETALLCRRRKRGHAGVAVCRLRGGSHHLSYRPLRTFSFPASKMVGPSQQHPPKTLAGRRLSGCLDGCGLPKNRVLRRIGRQPLRRGKIRRPGHCGRLVRRSPDR